jgi:alpha-amylase
VREIAKNYLRFLMDLGADGFRFDAAGHIEADFFREMKEFATEHNKFIYGEVLVHYNRIHEAWRYTPYMSLTDYPLLARMVDAFGFGGDLRILKWPAVEQKALVGTSAVTFVNNHDVHEHPWDFSGMALDSRSRDGRWSDMMLAQAYILGRGEGLPIVFRNDVFNPLTMAGVRFHEAMLLQPEYMRAAHEYHPNLDSPSVLVIERGTRGLVIINKGSQWADAPEAFMPGLDVGCYREERNSFLVEIGMDARKKKVTAWGSLARAGVSVGPRDALFLTKVSSGPCSF